MLSARLGTECTEVGLTDKNASSHVGYLLVCENYDDIKYVVRSTSDGDKYDIE